MTHFTERKHLIKWVMQNCTRKSVVRAMDEGVVEHLGAFTKLRPWEQPGWILKVTSDTGKLWIVCVVQRPAFSKQGGFSIYITPNAELPEPYVPWEHWYGGINLATKAEWGVNPLYSGDNPSKYARLRDERRAEIAKEDTIPPHAQ